MYSDVTNKNNSAVGYRMRKWNNVFARIYGQWAPPRGYTL